jgi:two-component system, LytTR family, sensor kinase
MLKKHKQAFFMKTESQLEMLQRELAESRLNALRSQMDPHFIFNAITTIQHFILNNEKLAALSYLDELSNLIRKFLEHARRPRITLTEELELLIAYINLESMRFSNKFGFMMNVGEEIDLDGVEIPSMLIQPYVENAIKHGLMHKTEYGSLSIDISLNENVLICVVEDNGIGRKKSKEINKWREKEHKSIGMEVTNERLEILNVTYNRNFNVEVIDLFDEEGEGAGTRIAIYIPVEIDK